MHYDNNDNVIIECFEDGTREGNPVVVAELSAEKPEYYGKLFAESEYMLQLCKDLSNLNLNINNPEKLEGIQNRARSILTSVGVGL